MGKFTMVLLLIGAAAAVAAIASERAAAAPTAEPAKSAARSRRIDPPYRARKAGGIGRAAYFVQCVQKGGKMDQSEKQESPVEQGSPNS